jgi:hypothetical protein
MDNVQQSQGSDSEQLPRAFHIFFVVLVLISLLKSLNDEGLSYNLFLHSAMLTLALTGLFGLKGFANRLSQLAALGLAMVFVIKFVGQKFGVH